MRTRLTLALAATTLLTAPLAALVPAQAASTSGTRIIASHPYTAAGSLRVAATHRSGRGADCEASNVTARPDAYRCYVGNQVIDPAFKSPTARSVAALEGNRWVEYRGVTTLHHDATGSSANVWRLRLANGAVCTAASGAGPAPIAHYPGWMGVCQGGPWNGSQLALWRTPASGAPMVTGAHGGLRAAVEYPLGSGHVTLVPVVTALR